MIDTKTLENLLNKEYFAKDIYGQLISVGNIVAYPGDQFTLREGIVLHIEDHQNYSDIIIHNATRIFKDNECLVTDDLLKFKNIDPVKKVEQIFADQTKNTYVYIMYVIDLNKNKEGFLLFKPEYTGINGFLLQLNKLHKQYPNFLYFPLSDFNAPKDRFDNVLQNYANIAETYNICYSSKNAILTPLRFQFTGTIKSFNYQLNHLSKATIKQLFNFKNYFNQFLEFSFDKDVKTDDISMTIQNEDYTKNIFGKFTTNDLYNGYMFFWQAAVPFFLSELENIKTLKNKTFIKNYTNEIDFVNKIKHFNTYQQYLFNEIIDKLKFYQKMLKNY